MKKIELTGKRFGRWLITSYSHEASELHGTRYYSGRCDCGTEKLISASSLRRGMTTSCGCYAAEKASKRLFKHGYSRTETYFIWKGMHQRCKAKDPHKYDNYGARGITVCKRWDKYENFLADMGERPQGLTIDRIDNDKGYSPSNCRWADNRTQANNKRGVHYITSNGETHSIADWARKLGISRYQVKATLA